jgi:thioredoxin-related protein
VGTDSGWLKTLRKNKAENDEKREAWIFKMRGCILCAVFKKPLSLNDALDYLRLEPSQIEDVI